MGEKGAESGEPRTRRPGVGAPHEARGTWGGSARERRLGNGERRRGVAGPMESP
jgi:hypothetical protein